MTKIIQFDFKKDLYLDEIGFYRVKISILLLSTQNYGDKRSINKKWFGLTDYFHQPKPLNNYSA